MTIRVLLAEDEAMVRRGLQLILDAAPGIAVVAEAARGDEVLGLVQLHQPDVCVLDIRMPGLDGIEVTRRLQRLPSPPRVLLCTTFEDDEYLDQGLRAGATGYLVKDGGPELLVAGVRAAAEGQSLLAPQLAKHIVADYLEQRSRPLTATVPLSQRELAIARGVGNGMTNQELAAAEHVAVSTIKTQLRSVQRKLGARNRVEVAIWAHEHLSSE